MKLQNSFIATSVLSLLAAFSVAGPASAVGSAFTCSAVTYQVVGNQLKIGVVDTSTSPAGLVYTDVGGPYSESYNGGGYNTVDNFIYAISGSGRLLQVASDGSVADLGAIAGLPGHFFAAGDVLLTGDVLIAIDSVDGSIFSVDLAGVSATNIGQLPTTPSVINVADIAIVSAGATTTAYGFDTVTGALVSFDPTARPIVVSVNTTVAVGAGGGKGAVWADSSGGLTTFVNTTGVVYSVANPSVASPVVTQIAQGTARSQNDGMKCATSASAFEPPAPPPTPRLALTGVDASAVTMTGIGILLVGFGFLTIVIRRRRAAK